MHYISPVTYQAGHTHQEQLRLANLRADDLAERNRVLEKGAQVPFLPETRTPRPETSNPKPGVTEGRPV